MSNTRKTLLSLFALLLLGGVQLGCNTTEGAGEDLENLGEEIEDAAD